MFVVIFSVSCLVRRLGEEVAPWRISIGLRNMPIKLKHSQAQ